jgi:hypothetical protein
LDAASPLSANTPLETEEIEVLDNAHEVDEETVNDGDSVQASNSTTSAGLSKREKRRARETAGNSQQAASSANLVRFFSLTAFAISKTKNLRYNSNVTCAVPLSTHVPNYLTTFAIPGMQPLPLALLKAQV